MKTFTIGFTQKKAEVFFAMLQSAGIKTLIDVRLNNVSQLAGFAMWCGLSACTGTSADKRHSRRL
jgi:uncharacterized protein (DUF488 family)